MELGGVVIGEDKVAKILDIHSGLIDLEIGTDFINIVSDKRVDVETLEGWDIYFNLKDKISSQVLNLGLVLKEKISSEARRNLEYVDLRFGNQVYYK